MQNAPTPEKVAKVIMHAITDENPKLRYSVGENVDMLLDARNRMSDSEFHNLLLQTVLH